MYIVVIGGGKVGYYLTKTLLAERHEVLLIEKDYKRARFIADDLGQGVVLRGDGAETATLERAGVSRADVVCAVTGEDEDNLVVCQVAKLHFNVNRTIARINNPKNEEIFIKLGITVTVSATEFILSLIEQEIPTTPFVNLLTLRNIGMEIVDIYMSDDCPWVGKRIGDLALPKDTVLAIFVRDGARSFPTPETVLQRGDRLIGLTSMESEATLHQMLQP
ncbi:MAG TPA: TrkA family potassium uptake protein [Chloroflexota bacterium]|jgi:trk system potassium uptake protein TrkA|nr:TrkA family potassium uptake protein [Chloroflexota bacterium]